MPCRPGDARFREKLQGNEKQRGRTCRPREGRSGTKEGAAEENPSASAGGGGRRGPAGEGLPAGTLTSPGGDPTREKGAGSAGRGWRRSSHRRGNPKRRAVEDSVASQSRGTLIPPLCPTLPHPLLGRA